MQNAYQSYTKDIFNKSKNVTVKCGQLYPSNKKANIMSLILMLLQ